MRIQKNTDTVNIDSLPGRTIEYIVVHYTAGSSSKCGEAKRISELFREPGREASADFIVDDETTVQYNPDPDNYYCWACGDPRCDSCGDSMYGVCTNRNSLSVELCSTNRSGETTFANDPCYFFTDAVLENGAELVAHLMDTYHIGISHVLRHYDVSGKLCPGIIGWNEESGNSDSWHAFLTACRQRCDISEKNEMENTYWKGSN